MSDTVACRVEVVEVEHLKGCGGLIGMAIVSVAIDDVELTLQGVQIRLADGQVRCQAPQFRDPKSGRWLPCILLPDELRDAIGNEVVAAYLPEPDYPKPLQSEI